MIIYWPFDVLFVCASLSLVLMHLYSWNRISPFFGKNILFVIAHPDDEAMFFVPTIRALLSEKKVTCLLLCLSSGNFDGLGKIREKELIASGAVLGISKDNIFIVDHEELKDGPNESWPKELIAGIVNRFAKYRNITSVITFDEFGVSSHPNHISVHHGVVQAHLDDPSYNFFVLKTVPLFLKFTSFFQSLSLPFYQNCIVLKSFSPLFSYRAMQAHASQFVWFRHLFVWFSSYSFVNILEQWI